MFGARYLVLVIVVFAACSSTAPVDPSPDRASPEFSPPRSLAATGRPEPTTTASPHAARLAVTGGGSVHCINYGGCWPVFLLEAGPARSLFDWTPTGKDVLFDYDENSYPDRRLTGPLRDGPPSITNGRWAVGLGEGNSSDNGQPSWGDVLCVREIEVTDTTERVTIWADFDQCLIDIDLEPDPQQAVEPTVIPIPAWTPPSGGIMDDCHYRTVLLRFDPDGRPWYEDVDTGEHIDNAWPWTDGSSLRIDEVKTLVTPDGTDGGSEFGIDGIHCVLQAGDHSWIGPYEAWDPWQRVLGEHAGTAARLAFEIGRGHEGGPPVVAATLTSSAIDEPDEAILRALDDEVRALGRDRMSTSVPGFYIAGRYGGPGGLIDALGSMGSSESDSGAMWLLIPGENGPAEGADGWTARNAKQFETPAGNVVWTVDENLTVWEDCSKLVVPPITPGPFEPGIETGIDPEGGIVTAYVDDADYDGFTLVAVDYDDPRCLAHPVIGPIIDHLLNNP